MLYALHVGIYTTFAEVKEIMRGPEAMRYLLEGHPIDMANITNDGGAHPYFDKHVAIAEGRINDALKTVGLEWPIADPTDERLRFAAGCLTINSLAPASNRDAYTIELAQIGEDYLEELLAGSLTVIGSEAAAEASSGITGRRVDLPMFDPYPDEFTMMDYLMPPLGHDPTRWR